MNQYIQPSNEVQQAIEKGKAVVALESTIISHGMPYPQNVATALYAEEIIRKQGAIPATIALLDGLIKVGLTKEEIDELGKKGTKVIKASRRDLPYLLAKKLAGATTVAATMIAANLAGIKVFATGGIGGVHRGAATSFDISADLQELANTDVVVVSAGFKSILDLGLTLEYLETYGVPIIGFGTDKLPAFYTRDSPHKLNIVVNTVEEIVDMIRVKEGLGLTGGMVVANPVPEAFQLEGTFINKIIIKAVKEAESLGIKGKEITPFLLAKVKELTGGKSLKTNIQLYNNNVELAGKIAFALSTSFQ